MKKIILSLALMLLAGTLSFAQQNKTTMPFLGLVVTGACDSTVNMKWQNNQLVFNTALVLKTNGGGYVYRMLNYDTTGTSVFTIEAFYNANNRADSAVTLVKVGPSTFTTTNRFTYDGNGKPVSEATFMQLIPGVYDSSEVYFYTYDGNGNMLSSTKRSKSSGSMKWKRKYTFTYNGSGKVTKQDEYDYNEGTSSWDLDGEATFTYDGNGNKTQEVRASYPGPVNYYRESTTYNGSNQRLIRTFESWNSTAWVPTGKDSTYYLGINGMKYNYTYTGGNYVFTDMDTCFTGSAPTSIQAPDALMPMQLYPNPAHTSVSFAVTGAQQTQVILTDVNGKTINAPVTLKNNTGTIDTQTLPTGIYFVHLTNGTQTANLKLIVTH